MNNKIAFQEIMYIFAEPFSKEVADIDRKRFAYSNLENFDNSHQLL
ncbi:MAG: hypothetical protein K2H79_00965 [Bacteroidaceae bacterium]|nr:hypothetical protein [Bacteroidaceae bacterium]